MSPSVGALPHLSSVAGGKSCGHASVSSVAPQFSPPVLPLKNQMGTPWGNILLKICFGSDLVRILLKIGPFHAQTKI